jgi:hypothetical protein
MVVRFNDHQGLLLHHWDMLWYILGHVFAGDQYIELDVFILDL